MLDPIRKDRLERAWWSEYYVASFRSLENGSFEVDIMSIPGAVGEFRLLQDCTTACITCLDQVSLFYQSQIETRSSSFLRCRWSELSFSSLRIQEKAPFLMPACPYS